MITIATKTHWIPSFIEISLRRLLKLKILKMKIVMILDGGKKCVNIRMIKLPSQRNRLMKTLESASRICSRNFLIIFAHQIRCLSPLSFRQMVLLQFIDNRQVVTGLITSLILKEKRDNSHLMGLLIELRVGTQSKMHVVEGF